jgi:hypothetical protein
MATPTTLTVGYAGLTTSSTINIGTAVNTAGTKTINIGTGVGASGSADINIGGGKASATSIAIDIGDSTATNTVVRIKGRAVTVVDPDSSYSCTWPAVGYGMIPLIRSTGYIELGLGLDLHATSADAVNYSTRMITSTGGAAEITSGYGYITIGPQNASYCHIYSDITGGFYMNQALYVSSGDLVIGKSRLAAGSNTTNGTANANKTITFGKTFAGTPTVVCQLTGSFTTVPRVMSTNTTAFVVQCGVANSTFNWIAMYAT